MKAAIVLNADSAQYPHRAAEVDGLLRCVLGADPLDVELWLLCREIDCASQIPRFSAEPSRVVVLCGASACVPETILCDLEQIAKHAEPDVILLGSGGLSAELATRLAFRFGGSSCVNVMDGALRNGTMEVSRPAYGNHMMARFALALRPYCICSAQRLCDPLPLLEANDSPIPRAFVPSSEASLCDQRTYAFCTDDNDNDEVGVLGSEAVLVLGRGAAKRETVDAMRIVAQTLGAQLGGTRPAVMNGWVEPQRLIGVSGAVISPKLCIVAGASGAPVFSFGVGGSKLLVAINTDPNAPIFRVAHVGIVADLEAVLVSLERIVKAAARECSGRDGEQGRGDE